MAFSNGFFKTAAVAAISAGALILSEPAFAFHGGGGFHGGGFHGGGFRGGGFGGGGFRGGGWAGRPGGWHGGGWAGRPVGGWNRGWGGGGWNNGWNGGWGWGAPVVAAPLFGWGWGGGWDNGWNNGYYAAPVYNQCFLRRVQVQTQNGWRWRRVRYCYQ